MLFRSGESLAYASLTYADLYSRVHATSLALKSLGLTSSDILAYYGPTSSASVILLLATTAIGATWSSAAADFGPAGVLERFEQFGDKLWGVVGVEAVRYNGKRLGQRAKIAEVVKGLLPGRQRKLEVVMVDYLAENEEVIGAGEEGWRTWQSVLEIGEGLEAAGGEMEFYQAPFDHPLWVLFSSGTTGKVCRCSARCFEAKLTSAHAAQADRSPRGRDAATEQEGARLARRHGA